MISIAIASLALVLGTYTLIRMNKLDSHVQLVLRNEEIDEAFLDDALDSIERRLEKLEKPKPKPKPKAKAKPKPKVKKK